MDALLFIAGFVVGCVVTWYRAFRAMDAAFDEFERENDL
jgi:hypothetical protein